MSEPKSQLDWFNELHAGDVAKAEMAKATLEWAKELAKVQSVADITVRQHPTGNKVASILLTTLVKVLQEESDRWDVELAAWKLITAPLNEKLGEYWYHPDIQLPHFP